MFPDFRPVTALPAGDDLFIFQSVVNNQTIAKN
jgi:hypothetical protein